MISRLYRSLCRERVRPACARAADGRRFAGMLIKWLLWPLIAIFAFSASAQVIDQIELQPDSNGEKEIVLKFYSDVVLTRFTPAREGQTIRIYFALVEQPGAIASLPREVRTGPEIAGVPRFTVSFPESDGSLSVAFNSAVKFRVRQVRGPRTISVFVAGATGGAAEQTPRGLARPGTRRRSVAAPPPASTARANASPPPARGWRAPSGRESAR